jgi:TolB protein
MTGWRWFDRRRARAYAATVTGTAARVAAAVGLLLLLPGGAPGLSAATRGDASAGAEATHGDTAPVAEAPEAESATMRSIETDIHAGVATLADDEMEGRGLGTKGIKAAAAWIEARLEGNGIDPAFAGGYRQPFKVKTGVRLLWGNRLDGVATDDWSPLGFSSPGEFAGPLVFAGYGIEAPEIGYRELDGLDLKGKVVLMLRYEPQERDEASPFDGKRPSRWSALRYKVLQARERGAAAVVFVTGPLQDEGKDKIPALKNDGPESPAGLPVLQVKLSVARRWLAPAGIDLDAFQRDVDRDLAPRSRDTGLRVAGKVAVEPIYTDAENVAGVIRGRGALAGECIVLGAHYDHLGMGGERSMRPNVSAVHNGADDNASGVASILSIAGRLKRRMAALRSHRTVVLAFFSGEEVGLAGSSAFVADPPFPLDHTIAMINLDMVGHLRDDTLVALGSDSAPEWGGEIDRALVAVPGLKVSGHGDGYGPSDQTSFYASSVPVLQLFTGATEEYHTPDDDTDTLNYPGAARVARFTLALATVLAEGPEKLTWVRSGAGPTMAGDSRGYGAYLGTIPDYRAMEATEGGVLLGDVRAGGPADRAGIRGGDRIVEMAGTRIENLYDMTYALQDHKPEDTIDVVVLRDGKRLTLRATLGDRAKMNQAPAPAAPGKDAAPSANENATSPHDGGAAPAKDGAAQENAAPAKEQVPPPHEAPAAPAAKETAASPHDSGTAPGGKEAAGGIAPFYENRPGPAFVIGAGKPFEKSFDGERHLRDVRQLTFGGENAEAYFSPDGRHLIFQSTPRGAACDQEYTMDLATGEVRRVSSGKGRTTCGYYDWPEADRIIYASTEGGGDACPPPPDYSKGYVWALYDSYDIYEARPDGSDTRPLIVSPGYDAEATWCHRGGRFVFTSTRDGDIDLYVSDEAGNIKRLTSEPGYDGGAFFSPDCSEIVWRASRPQGKELEDYRALLQEGFIRPHTLEIYVMKSDGTGVRQITHNGAANFCPYFSPDGRKVIYASNAGSRDGREFDLWLVDAQGGEPERITTAPGFDGFPQWSPDGLYLVWGSNRADPASHETNLFIARWAD